MCASHAFLTADADSRQTCSPSRIQLPNDRPETYLSALPEKIQKGTDLVLCILPNNRKDRYDALKKYMCLDNPVPSQVRWSIAGIDHLERTISFFFRWYWRRRSRKRIN